MLSHVAKPSMRHLKRCVCLDSFELTASPRVGPSRSSGTAGGDACTFGAEQKFAGVNVCSAVAVTSCSQTAPKGCLRVRASFIVTLGPLCRSDRR